MAELTPYPFAPLVRRAFRELDAQGTIFDLPRERFFDGDPTLDLGVSLHGHRVSSPLGPAAGPHTQMAQNLVLAWLGGSRVFELKTVQIRDDLDIPRPCIDMRTVGFNAEWSQELRLGQSLEEYVKGAMLIQMLEAGPLPSLPGFGSALYDLSVGYDLEGIRSPQVQAFLRGMMDAGATVERLRREIPREVGELRDLEFTTRLADTLTLSTFHGCPPDEIEKIVDFLLRDLGLHCTVKFNPTLLGPEETRGWLHDTLGYTDLEVPQSAFEKDTTWEQAVEMVGRLGETARELGLSFGVKLSNTLIVRNTRGFLPESEAEVYLSGAPLHVLAVQLVERFRRTFGDRFPISFAAGVDRQSFPELAALGLTPITVCSDLLAKGGYGRLKSYYDDLARRMETVGARDLEELTLRAYGEGLPALDDLAPEAEARDRCREAFEKEGNLRQAAGEDLYRRWLGQARLRNTERYAALVAEDERFRASRNARPPRKIGRHLKLFDCLTCDICVPVCPNDANFTFGEGPTEIPSETLVREAEGWSRRPGPPLVLGERHQIGNFADFCNDCGNCDVFCPEDGGPYAIKPRFFGRQEDWRQLSHLDGFYLERRGDRDLVLGRIDGEEMRLEVEGERCVYRVAGLRVSLRRGEPGATLEVEEPAEVEEPNELDLTPYHILDYLRRAILEARRINYIHLLSDTPFAEALER